MFIQLQKTIQKKHDAILKLSKLFQVTVDREKIFEIYINAFAPDKRQEHVCNCCRSFLRQWGGLVGIVDYKKVSIWDIDLSLVDQEYHASIKAVAEYVKSLPVTDLFMTDTFKLGSAATKDGVKGITWNHFALDLTGAGLSKMSTDSIPSKQGEIRDIQGVFFRGLSELTSDAFDTVLELTASNSIYRGTEFKSNVEAFLRLKKQFDKLKSDEEKRNFAWFHSLTQSVAVTKLRGSAIGTLLVNLSEGMELDTAVAKYESVVAPQNYKRTTALATPRMIEDARKKLTELGYLESLERRFAVATDLSVNDVLFVDRATSLSDVFADMKKDVIVNPRTFSKVDEVSINDFIEKILPTAKGIEVLPERVHFSNLMTLLTAKDPEAKNMFKWNNPFSWAYAGDITDSIKERVKEAGGQVDGEIRISLSWHNYDDLDLQVREPGGNLIYYGNKGVRHKSSGMLDVDMNAGGGRSRTPVENIIYTNKNVIPNGKYSVEVNQFSFREASNSGFTVQVECRGELQEYHFETSQRSGVKIVTQFEYNKEKGIIFSGETKVDSTSNWGIDSNKFVKVKTITTSPNHWGENPVGNKHYFFVLEGCKTEDKTRPFFNEFLNQELTDNRKVLEMLGAKLMIEPAAEQLSGLGFSETKRNSILVRVSGTVQRVIKVNF